MSRIHTLNQRYAASEALVMNGVEIVAVGDPVGARLNTAVRRLLVTAKDATAGFATRRKRSFQMFFKLGV